MIEWIKDQSHFEQVKKEHEVFLVVVFYADFSPNAKRSLKELEEFDKENSGMPVYIVDVQKVKGLHKQFGVASVPTVLALQNGKTVRRIEGVESSQFYARVLCGAHPSLHKSDKGKKVRRVIVYSSPGCPACGLVKTYLRKQGVAFREVDISRDQNAAERLARRSGQMAVPQIDIDGNLVVGFDKSKIDRILST
ncbi:MAG: thioredoxin family protein [Candidatus Omnitrophica bacterium]|nr:thioredoxin family protein [Candidatus Omnitrophota bacterium]